MLCETVLGTLSEGRFQGLAVDYVDIEWFEAFTKLHRKKSRGGEDVGIRLGNEILRKGLRQDDVLYADPEKVIAVNIPACEAIKVTVEEDAREQLARVCYEIGNTHSALFWGEDFQTFLLPFQEPLFLKLSRFHGVSVEKVVTGFDFSKAISAAIHNHHH